MQLPTVVVASRRPVLIPELVIPSRRPATRLPVESRRPRQERWPIDTRWLGPRRGMLVDVYA